jgi:hypothetical protein
MLANVFASRTAYVTGFRRGLQDARVFLHPIRTAIAERTYGGSETGSVRTIQFSNRWTG